MCLVLQNSHAAVAKKKTTSTASKEKLKDTDRSAAKIRSLVTKMAASPVVSLTDSTFGKFVIERPREYTAFLMFTATAKQYQCSVCVRAKTVLEEVAQYYMEQYDFNSTAVANRIAFFRIEVDDARATFNDMQLETVPRLYLLPPTTSDSPKMKMSDYEVESKFLMESASATLGEIHARSGIKVP